MCIILLVTFLLRIGSSSDDSSATAADVEMTALEDIQTDRREGSEHDDTNTNLGQSGSGQAVEWIASVTDEVDSNTCVFLLKTTYIHACSCLALYTSDEAN